MMMRFCVKIRLRSGDDSSSIESRFKELADCCGFPVTLISVPGVKEMRKVVKDGAGNMGGIFETSVAYDKKIRRMAETGKRLLVTADPPLIAFDTEPVAAGELFGDRSLADHLIRAESLRRRGGDGESVNVVIVDHGLNQARAKGRFAGGWWRYGDRIGQIIEPGDGRSEHAEMVLRNVLAMAPNATIWDVPLLPETEKGPPSVALAESVFHHIREDIAPGRQRSMYFRPSNENKPRTIGSKPGGGSVQSWVFVNAWGVLDPARYDICQDYVGNPNSKFVKDMAKFNSMRDPVVDVVFAAGNCGEPTALPTCGLNWSGPGRSILGANAHPDVLTVGAVRVDGVPLGFSAQGPGRLAGRWPTSDHARKIRAHEKPDVSAPSCFVERDDAALLNTGTSAAAGIAAGVIAALRSIESKKWQGSARISAATLRKILRDSARRPAGGDAGRWDERLGFGIVDCESAVQMLEKFHRGDS